MSKLNRIDAMLARAAEAYTEYRQRFDQVSGETAKAMMRTTLVMMANYDHEQGDIDDHEHEQRLVFIMSANLKALRNELLS